LGAVADHHGDPQAAIMSSADSGIRRFARSRLKRLLEHDLTRLVLFFAAWFTPGWLAGTVAQALHASPNVLMLAMLAGSAVFPAVLCWRARGSAYRRSAD
jgi:hypothetical protein